MKRTFGHEDAGRATPESIGAIVKTHDIRIFLEGNDKRYIVGPKGTGKSLMLLRKAIDQRKRADGLCIPSIPGNPVDRLTAAEHVGVKFNFQISSRSEASLAWASVWKHAIFRSILHHVREEALAEVTHAGNAQTDAEPWARDILNNRNQELRAFFDRALSQYSPVPLGPFHYFTEIGAKLDASGHKALAEVREDVLYMTGLLHAIRRPVYVFLDNLDDYYELQPALWVRSMYGQLRAVREITLAHKNIHVFTSIRQDVFEQFDDEMKLQHFDYVAYLRYSKRQLLEIFESHLAELDDDLLAEPPMRKKNPWLAFFGNTATLHNAHADCDEDVSDYVHRHTLGRPRDMIHMGTVLLQSMVGKDFTETDVRSCVNRAARDIAEQYLREVAPLVEEFDIAAFVQKFVIADVLELDQIESATAEYLRDLEAEGYLVTDAEHCESKPFETLFELGLLGFVREVSESGSCIQQFRYPGQGLSPRVERKLPRSSHYFVHPVLRHLCPADMRKSETTIGDQLETVCGGV